MKPSVDYLESGGKKALLLSLSKVFFLLAPWVLQDKWDRVVLQLRKGSHLQNRAQNQSRWINSKIHDVFFILGSKHVCACKLPHKLTMICTSTANQMQWLYMSIHYTFVYMNKQLKVLLCPPAAEMEDEVSDAMLKEVCITIQTQYYFENNQLSFRGNIDCENCTRSEYPPLLGFTAGV